MAVPIYVKKKKTIMKKVAEEETSELELLFKRGTLEELEAVQKALENGLKYHKELTEEEQKKVKRDIDSIKFELRWRKTIAKLGAGLREQGKSEEEIRGIIKRLREQME
jgi:hypothetical protein